MSYYDSPQWSGPGQNSWEHQSGTSTPVRTGANGPQSQDEYAFSYQFDEVDRAFENLQKSAKGYGMGRRELPKPGELINAARTSRRAGGLGHVVKAATNHSPSPVLRADTRLPRSHVSSFDDGRGPQNLSHFYAAHRHQPSRGAGDAEQVLQAKRRMAAQRERELRNLHTEQQYQRNVLTEVPQSKQMSEEETRDLIARQRSALYGEGPFADKNGYVDETGNVRPGAPPHSGPSSMRGPSPMTFDAVGRAPDAPAPASTSEHASPRPQSTTSPAGPTNRAFEAVGPQSRTSTSSPGGSPPLDVQGSKPGMGPVAPIGTRPSAAAPAGKHSPLAGGWGRGNGVWGQSGLGAQASVWG
ncbi:hypothetical protein DCS_05133 [Drechmeria coniospora]|uniref:Uncharacterized protein n=1 Tax=Drechmeria coniospora TaxID=98403 RepID=A0A151GLZ0_DRECN|nr:hypothetical protein DCS_05133 [Drechmeria coniospora]KYK58120.1 hypothetical protein DCS_05133 [Drechmeria coniospora]ODA83041.1 hypothetical protein RJ55_01550 [Drechmeria coniospora]